MIDPIKIVELELLLMAVFEYNLAEQISTE
jgi:hypothetical protein